MKKNVRDVLHNIRIGILSSTEKMIKILSKICSTQHNDENEPSIIQNETTKWSVRFQTMAKQ